MDTYVQNARSYKLYRDSLLAEDEIVNTDTLSMEAFISGIIDVYGKLSDAQKASLKEVYQYWLEYGDGDARKLAYIIATAEYESGLEPKREVRGQPGTLLWNLQSKYWNSGYYGRGLVQITFKKNYKKASDLFQIDFVKYPDLMLDIKNSARILVYGMMNGIFTESALSLSRYFTDSKSDWLNARQIVNGLDKAQLFADKAKNYYESFRKKISSDSESLEDYYISQYSFSEDVPLGPVNGGRCIMASELEMGDIILSTTDQIPSKIIRYGTNSPVSHAILYIGDGEQVVEAIAQGVVMRPLTEAIADASFAVAVRYPNLTNTQQLMIRDYVGRQIGKKFNYFGVIKLGKFIIHKSRCAPLKLISNRAFRACERWSGTIELGNNTSSTVFCSELIVNAFKFAKAPLTTSPANWTSPADLAKLEFVTLNYVGHLKTN